MAAREEDCAGKDSIQRRRERVGKVAVGERKKKKGKRVGGGREEEEEEEEGEWRGGAGG